VRTCLRRLVVVVGVVGVVLVGVAVGAAVGSRRASSPIEAAVAKSAAAGSVRFDFTLAASGAAIRIPVGTLSVSGSGAADWQQKTAEVQLDLGSLAPLLSVMMKGALVPSTVEVLAVNGAVYVHLAALASQLGAPGKQWVKFDLSKLHSPGSESVPDKPAINPRQTLASLQSALSISEVGSDQYGAHYHASLNLSAAIALLPTAKQASAQARLARVGIKTVPIDVWIASNGTVSRVALSITREAHAAVAIAFALNLHDYGSPVSVTPPPTSATADGSKLLTNLRMQASRHGPPTHG
jgi:hypothetical protein